ncbi:MAG: hypothetical protein QGG88_04660 [Gammaproteobacteria bacterium]|nr:hypothetical protein [Gammaproteobacteria bacterium]
MKHTSSRQDGWALLLSLLMVLLLAWPLLSLLQQAQLQINLQAQSLQVLQAQLEASPLLSKGGLSDGQSAKNTP